MGDPVTTQANEKFHQKQIQDVLGKGDIDEKIVMKVTGAREPLKKAHKGRIQFGNLEEGMSIFDILEMFRDGNIDAEAADPF